METDISQMGEFESRPQMSVDYSDFQQQQQHYIPQPTMYHQPPPLVKKTDLFADIDKKVWIFMLVALIIGFFMGKTMQPIILRSV